MPIENIPEIYLENQSTTIDVFAYDFKMTQDVIKTKVNLNMHMFSFLQTGKKQVHFAGTSILVDNKQSLLIKKGNCLWSELLDDEAIYYCKLFFFSEKKLKEFLIKHHIKEEKTKEENAYFIIENDTYITSYLNSLSSLTTNPNSFIDDLLSLKFEELMLYLVNKYGESFKSYLFSLISEKVSIFQKTIDQNVYSALTLEEISFLCNMSLSTFKRHFISEYNVSPGKWLRDKRLLKAKELLENKKLKSSDIYLEFGYNNLSNFSNAFKNKFGINPTDI